MEMRLCNCIPSSVCVCLSESCVGCEVFCYKKKCNEGGPASSKEDSVQGGGADSISFVGAMK